MDQAVGKKDGQEEKALLVIGHFPFVICHLRSAN